MTLHTPEVQFTGAPGKPHALIIAIDPPLIKSSTFVQVSTPYSTGQTTEVPSSSGPQSPGYPVSGISNSHWIQLMETPRIEKNMQEIEFSR